jgi:uncharacterized protein (DUF58 family)
VVAVIAVATGGRAALMWAVAVGALAGASIAWSRLAWRGVEVTARFRPARIFAGEPVRLEVTVRNAKRLPLPHVYVRAVLPEGLRPGEPTPAAIRGMERRFAMGGRSEVTLDLPVESGGRGEFWLQQVVMELADPFRLAPLEREIELDADLIILPEPRIEVPIDIRRRLPFGRPTPALRMFEDRERFAGVRPYEPGDPLNRVHWKLSARGGGIQVKRFEPTRSAEVLLVLDLAVGEPFWDAIYPEIAEDTIGWASFIAREAIDAGWRVSLAANTHLTRGRGPLRIRASTAANHEAAVFASLARMPADPTADAGPVLREASRGLAPGVSVVLISPRPGPRLLQEMDALRRRGVEVVHASPLSPVGTPGAVP